MSVIQLKHLITHIESSATTTAEATKGNEDDLLHRIQDYRKQYGVDY